MKLFFSFISIITSHLIKLYITYGAGKKDMYASPQDKGQSCNFATNSRFSLVLDFLYSRNENVDPC